MDFQSIIVAVIVLAALFYVGQTIRRKVKAFSAKSPSCGAGCGCASDLKQKM